MDQWANPMVVSALWSSRDGTMDPDPVANQSFQKVAPPTLNKPDPLTRWDPWVRSTLGVTELTRLLDYKPTVATNTFEVLYRDTPTTTKSLVEMQRPDEPFFKAQLGFVQSWAELRDERALEILAQIDNQYAFIAAVTGLHVARKKWTMEWLMIAVQFMIEVELMFKHAFACYRPVDFSPQVQPIISTPGHGTYPMGHAAQAFITVVALTGLLKIPPNHPTYVQLMRQARRISVNRVVAGVHFPVDAPAGQVLGLTLGEFFLSVSNIATPCLPRTFKPAGLGDDPKNDYLGEGKIKPDGGTEGIAIPAIAFSPYLDKMQTLASAEWVL